MPAIVPHLPVIRGVVMQKLVCEECGARFNCGAPVGKDRCWCMDLPNLRGSFDLAGQCVCPDCLTAGTAKSMIRARKARQRQRAATSIRRQNRS
jgi:hypothetical protein